jgi:uncharacterized repeat protein (TIGR04138 family)
MRTVFPRQDREKEPFDVKSREVDWPAVRTRAAMFPEDAFEFVRDGLKHTVQALHGPACSAPPTAAERRHVSGQQLCMGLRDLAIQRWGLLAPTVLKKWGLTRTEDFGTIVYAMIDRCELRSSDNDSMDDFRGVFDFDEVFGSLTLA